MWKEYESTLQHKEDGRNQTLGTTIWMEKARLTASDARLKNVIGQSDSAKDLETLEKIEITDYTVKDVVKEGDAPSKKVIAQQVEKVYPTASRRSGTKGLHSRPTSMQCPVL